jgi:hypothetical protein
VTDNLLDLAVRLEVLEHLSCKRSVNLQAVDEGGNGDEAVGLDILLDPVVLLLGKNDVVLGLVLDYTAVSGDSYCERPRRAGAWGMRRDKWKSSSSVPTVFAECA